MKTHIFLTLVFGVVLHFSAHADIIQWFVSGNETVDNSYSLYTYLGNNYDSDQEYGVRLAAYDQSGYLVSYLNPIYFDEGGNSFVDREFNDQYVGTRDDFWMTQASQALYEGSSAMDMLYQIQVGSYDGDYNFNAICFSTSELVDDKYRYDAFSLLPPSMDWQVGAFYTSNPVGPAVPEPSSGLLFILGSSLLLLKRKHI